MRLLAALLATLLVVRSAIAGDLSDPANSAPAASRSLLRILASPTDGDVGRLFEEFSNPDPVVRRRAINAYGIVSEFVQNSEVEATQIELDRFQQLLHDSDPSVRKSAIRAIASRVTPDFVLLPDLHLLLKDHDPTLRLELLQVLNDAEPIESFVPDLVSIVRDDKLPLAAAALVILVKWDQSELLIPMMASLPAKLRQAAACHAISPLLETLLADHDGDACAAAIERMGSLNRSNQSPVRDRVLKSLTDRRCQVRKTAGSQINSLDWYYLEMEQVLKVLSTSDPNWDRSSIWSSIAFSDELRDHLMDLVADPTRDTGLRAEALAVLTHESNDGEHTAKRWVKLIVQDPSQPLLLRVAGLRAFRHGKDSISVPLDVLMLGTTSLIPVSFREAAVHVLVDRYPDVGKPFVRQQVAETMAELKMLERDLEVSDDQRPIAWALTLFKVAVEIATTPEEKWQYIALAVDSGHAEVRQAAVTVIGELAQDDAEFPLDPVNCRKLLADVDQSISYDLVFSLQWCDVRGERRVAVIAEELLGIVLGWNVASQSYGQEALEILVRCDKVVASSFPRVMKEFVQLDSQLAWRDEDLQPRWDFLLDALVQLFPDEPEVAAVVKRVFENEEIRDENLYLLSKLGPRLSVLRPQLIALLNDPHVQIDQARDVIDALGHLGPGADSGAEIPLLESRLEVPELQLASAMALLRLAPKHAKAGAMLADHAIRESNEWGCFRGRNESFHFLQERRADGVQWMVDGLRDTEAPLIGRFAEQILSCSDDDGTVWLEPALREIAYDDRLEQEVRTQAQEKLRARCVSMTN